MKKILVVVFAVVVGLGAVQAKAQIPYLQIYFDDYWTQTTATCPTAPIGTVFGTAYVVGHNWNAWVQAIEYKIAYPGVVSPLNDIVTSCQLKIGSSSTGIAITWIRNPTAGCLGPANGWEAFLVQEIFFVWMCDDCSVLDIPWPIINYWTTDPTNHTIQAVRWPDNAWLSGVGLTAFICPDVPVTESTWGGIKALYRD
jgi:hypothetical protein